MRYELLLVGLALSSCAQMPTRPPAEPTALRFVVVGDTQGNGGNPGTAECVPSLLRDIRSRQPDFVVFTGDLVGTGSRETLGAWEQLTSVFGERRYMVPGNHDLPGRPASNFDWQELFSWLPDSQAVDNVVTPEPGDTIRGIDQMDYWFDPAPGVRIVCVTTDRDALPDEPHTYSGGYEIAGGQPRALDWFQSVMALESTKSKPWLFVMTHHPVTSSMSQFGAPEHFELQAGTPSEWWRSIAGRHPTLDLARADALLSGHVHGYYPNHPDPHTHTAEMILGTGGGSPEGVPHRRRHGFTEITIVGEEARCVFWGDGNGAHGGWSFTERLDEFELSSGRPLAAGLKASYRFEWDEPLRDSADSAHSKQHPLRLNQGACFVEHPERGCVLSLNGLGFADAKALGDQNLQLLGDLRLSLHAKAVAPLGDEPLDNVLVAFGDADGAGWNGTWLRVVEEEIANYAYIFSYAADGRLQLSWEHHDDPRADTPCKRVSVLSTEPVPSPRSWHRLEVQRSAEERSVRFFVDGQALGEAVAFEHLPTGGGTGSLYLGALPDTEQGSERGIATFTGFLDNVEIANRIEAP